MELLFYNKNNQVYYHNFLELLYVYRKGRLVATYDTINKSFEQVLEKAENVFEIIKNLDNK